VPLAAAAVAGRADVLREMLLESTDHRLQEELPKDVRAFLIWHVLMAKSSPSASNNSKSRDTKGYRTLLSIDHEDCIHLLSDRGFAYGSPGLHNGSSSFFDTYTHTLQKDTVYPYPLWSANAADSGHLTCLSLALIKNCDAVVTAICKLQQRFNSSNNNNNNNNNNSSASDTDTDTGEGDASVSVGLTPLLFAVVAPHCPPQTVALLLDSFQWDSHDANNVKDIKDIKNIKNIKAAEIGQGLVDQSSVRADLRTHARFVTRLCVESETSSSSSTSVSMSMSISMMFQAIFRDACYSFADALDDCVVGVGEVKGRKGSTIDTAVGIDIGIGVGKGMDNYRFLSPLRTAVALSREALLTGCEGNNSHIEAISISTTAVSVNANANNNGNNGHVNNNGNNNGNSKSNTNTNTNNGHVNNNGNNNGNTNNGNNNGNTDTVGTDSDSKAVKAVTARESESESAPRGLGQTTSPGLGQTIWSIYELAVLSLKMDVVTMIFRRFALYNISRSSQIPIKSNTNQTLSVNVYPSPQSLIVLASAMNFPQSMLAIMLYNSNRGDGINALGNNMLGVSTLLSAFGPNPLLQALGIPGETETETGGSTQTQLKTGLGRVSYISEYSALGVACHYGHSATIKYLCDMNVAINWGIVVRGLCSSRPLREQDAYILLHTYFRSHVGARNGLNLNAHEDNNNDNNIGGINDNASSSSKMASGSGTFVKRYDSQRRADLGLGLGLGVNQLSLLLNTPLDSMKGVNVIHNSIVCIGKGKRSGRYSLNSHGGGETLLHVCARRDMARLAVLLLQYGADPRMTDDRGVLPLVAAVASGSGRATKVRENVGFILYVYV